MIELITSSGPALVIAFAICAGIVFYAYVGYPMLLAILSKVFGRYPESRAPRAPEELPTVTLLVAAHNEESVIKERVENALSLSYPEDKIEILIASDGSSDRTAEIVRSFDSDRVRLLDFQPNRGKSHTLNAAMPEANGEIMVLSDANTDYEPDAIQRLVRWFSDPAIAAVSGKLQLHDPETGNNVDSLYWRYESVLKAWEGRLGAKLGANGAIYAFRREMYEPIPNNTIIDDFTIPLLIKLKHGGRVVFDPTAVAHEESPEAVKDEFKRRARIGTGAYQSLALLWPLLSPRYTWTSFCFFSHKVMRWLVPFCLVAMLVICFIGIRAPLFQALLVCQIVILALAAIGPWLPGRSLPVRLVRVITMFTTMNAALLVGFWRWLTRPQSGTWRRTARLEKSEA